MSGAGQRPVVAGNWKMHKGPTEARAFCEALVRALGDGPAPLAEMLLFPPAVSLHLVAEHEVSRSLGVGSQTVHPEPSGAFTGELSAEMAADAGAGWSLVGHSERRHVFGESDADVAARAAACRRAGLHPVVCVGETLEERTSGRLEEVLARQLEAVLPDVPDADPASWAIAYEPVWAIGTGETASPDDAREAHAFLRSVLDERGIAVPRILYGGSVKPANAGELLGTEGVDGVLVGGASLDADDFLAIARAADPR
ncbi:MAG TPA: triose-phosphate isomerase [Longimicrobiales bacterium]|nr:triose-phosphate isomerase [Longimicrobiales bacterium]